MSASTNLVSLLVKEVYKYNFYIYDWLNDI